MNSDQENQNVQEAGTTVQAPRSPRFGPVQANAFLTTLEEYIPGPCIRHGLSMSQNGEVRKILKDAFDELRAEVHALALQPEMRFANMHEQCKGFIEKAVARHPLSLAGGAGACASSDVKQFNHGFHHVVEVMSYLETERLKTGPGLTMAILATENIEKMAIGIGRNVLKTLAPKPISQDALDNAAREMSARFGLDGVGFGSETAGTNQRMRWLQRTANAVEESCRRLGIEPVEFGRQKGVSLIIGNLDHLGFAGAFLPNYFPGSQLLISPTTPFLAGALTHEYIHQLDHFLGIQALSKKIKQDPEFVREKASFSGDYPTPFFSDLPLSLQSMLPQAREGLNKVFSLLSTGSASPHGSDQTHSEDAATSVHGQARDRTLRERINQISDVFLAQAIGMEKMHAMGAHRLSAIRKSLSGDDHQLLLDTTKNLTRMPPQAAFQVACHTHFKKTGLPHPFMAHMDELMPEHSKALIANAIKNCADEFCSAAALQHPANQASNPSKMLIDSICKDMNRTQLEPTKPYQSQSVELLARLIDRPQSIYGMHADTYRKGWQQAISAQQGETLTHGLTQMLQSAGVKMNQQGPQLMGIHEVSADSLVKKVVRPVYAGVERTIRFIDFLSGVPSPKSPQKSASPTAP